MSTSATDLSSGRDALSVLAFRGPDAAKFLQGQLSADIEKIAPGGSVLAGLHNPQGRVIAMLALTRTSGEEILAVLPRELVDAVAPRLRKYVLRAKVRVDDEAAWRVVGASAADPSRPSIAWGDRWLIVDARAALAPTAPRDAWERLDIETGIPQVYAATSESFVAQMLNLDLLGAIAFDKGCYTGQEVIARAHYRGRVKRRLQRWHHAGNALVPGAAAKSVDGRALTVVRVAATDDGGQDVLAVGPFLDGAATDEAPIADASADAAPRLEPRPLPYPLPE